MGKDYKAAIDDFFKTGAVIEKAAIEFKRRAEASEAREAALNARVGELEEALQKLISALDNGMEPWMYLHYQTLREDTTILEEARQALSAQPSAVREAERAVVEAAMAWQQGPVGCASTLLEQLWDNCANLAKLREGLEKGDG